MANLDQLYLERMMVHSCGYGLYKPRSTKELRPGSIGYFNTLGLWTPVAHLNDVDSLRKYGLSEPKDELEAMEPNERETWGPKYSKGVHEWKVDSTLHASGDAVGAPVGGQIHMKYKADNEFGAILVTAKPIRQEGYYHTSPFKKWYKANLRSLLSCAIAKDIREFGLFVITQTHSTTKCSVAAWQDSSREVSLGLDLDGANVANVGAHGRWYTEGAAGGWSDYEGSHEVQSVGKRSKQSTKKYNDSMVVFVSGLHFNTKTILGKPVHTRFKLLGVREGLAEDDKQITEDNVQLNDDEYCEVTITRIGRLPPAPMLSEESYG